MASILVGQFFGDKSDWDEGIDHDEVDDFAPNLLLGALQALGHLLLQLLQHFVFSTAAGFSTTSLVEG